MAKLFLTPSISFAPKRWAVMTARPEVNPFTNPMIKKLKLPVQPTAARQATDGTSDDHGICHAVELLEDISNNQGKRQKKISLAGFPLVMFLVISNPLKSRPAEDLNLPA